MAMRRAQASVLRGKIRQMIGRLPRTTTLPLIGDCTDEEMRHIGDELYYPPRYPHR